MAVSLGEYVDQVRDKVNPPGINLYPAANDDEWSRRLAGAFWDARLQGITALDAYTEADEDIIPQGSGDEITRDLVQLIICWAAWQATVNAMNNLKTLFAVQAGPVRYETQQSATVLKAVMDNLRAEKAAILERLAENPEAVALAVVDLVSARDCAIYAGATSWVSG